MHPLRVEDAHGLREVVPLHHGALGRVERGQDGVGGQLEGVVGAAVVEIVAEASHEQGKDLEVTASITGERVTEEQLEESSIVLTSAICPPPA